MKTNPDYKSNCILYFISFLAALLGMIILIAIKHVSPLGDGTFAVMDANIQYIDYFGYLKDVLSGNQDILYTMNKSLGGTNMVVLSFYLISPFNILVLLFEKSSLMTFFTLAVTLKVATSSLTMSVFIRHTFKNLDKRMVVVMALCYGLMHYNMAQLSNIEFLDGVYMLPLILLGVSKAVREKKSLLLIVSVALSMIFSWYTGAINCLFSAVWLLYELLQPSLEERFKSILRYAYSMALGIGMSMFILLPTVLAMQGGRAGVDFFVLDSFDISNALSFIKGSTLGVLGDKENPGLFCGSIIFLGVIAIIISKYSSIKERIVDIALLAMAYLMMYCPPIVFLFSLLKDVDSYWYRYGYTFLFIFIFLATKYYDKTQENKNPKRIRIEIIVGLSLYAIVNISVALLDDTPHYKRMLVAIILAICGGAAYIIYISHNKKMIKNLCYIIVLLVVSAELIYSGYLFVGAGDSVYKDYVENQSRQIEEVKSNDRTGEFYRISQDDTRIKSFGKERLTANYNESLVYNYPSIVSYTSDPENVMRDFMDSVGYRSNGKNINVVNTCNLAVDSFLGVRYELMKYPVKGLYKLDKVGEANGKEAYENKYALPIGITVKGDDDNYPYSDNPFENVNRIYSDILGESVSLYEPVNYNKQYDGKTIRYDLQGYNTDYPVYGNVLFEGEFPLKITENDSLITEYNQWLAPSVFPVGAKADRTHVVVSSMEDGQDIEDSSSEEFYQLNLERLSYATNKIKEDKIDSIKVNNGEIVIDEYSDNSKEIMLLIPYEEGWSGTNNGENVDISTKYGCFMTLNTKPGNNHIELSYRVLGLREGIIISIVCAIIVILMCIFHRFLRHPLYTFRKI